MVVDVITRPSVEASDVSSLSSITTSRRSATPGPRSVTNNREPSVVHTREATPVASVTDTNRSEDVVMASPVPTNTAETAVCSPSLSSLLSSLLWLQHRSVSRKTPQPLPTVPEAARTPSCSDCGATRRTSTSLPFSKRRRLSPILDGLSICATPSLGGDSRNISDDVAISTGAGIVPAMFEALSLEDLETARRESNLRGQYFLALCEAARKQAAAASEHAETLGALVLIKKGVKRNAVASSSH